MGRREARIGGFLLAVAACTEDIRLYSDAGRPDARTGPASACQAAWSEPLSFELSAPADACYSLARDSFRYALCVCDSATLGAFLQTDGFDSSAAATATGLAGASVGSDQGLVATGGFDLSGSLGVAGVRVLELHRASYRVRGNVRVAGDLLLDRADVQLDRELFLQKNALSSGSSARVAGSVHQAAGGMLPSDVAAMSGVREEDVRVDAPCPCRSTLGADFLRLRRHFSAQNMDAALGLGPDALATHATLELPCGLYSFEGATLPAVSWHVRGQAALFVDGDVQLNDRLEVTFEPGATLDVLIHGNLTLSAAARIETARPAALRVYVSGGSLRLLGSGAQLAGNVYAPNASLVVSDAQTIRGALVVSNLAVSAPLTLHYDLDVQRAPAASGCEPPACSQEADCQAPLVCSNGQCALE